MFLVALFSACIRPQKKAVPSGTAFFINLIYQLQLLIDYISFLSVIIPSNEGWYNPKRILNTYADYTRGVIRFKTIPSNIYKEQKQRFTNEMKEQKIKCFMSISF